MVLWSKTGTKPKHLTRVEKRTVIATPQGWVKRSNYTDAGSNVRVKDEILVAISGLSAEVTMGNPDITDVYVSNTTGGSTIKRNLVNRVYVVFSEPISIGASASPFRLTIANTASGNTVIATANTNKAAITNANNTLVFKFKANTVGTYKIQAQNLSNTAQAKVYGVYGGSSETVNTNISATVSNTNSTFSIVA